MHSSCKTIFEMPITFSGKHSKFVFIWNNNSCLGYISCTGQTFRRTSVGQTSSWSDVKLCQTRKEIRWPEVKLVSRQVVSDKEGHQVTRSQVDVISRWTGITDQSLGVRKTDFSTSWKWHVVSDCTNTWQTTGSLIQPLEK